MLCKGAKEKNWNPALKGTERMLAIYDYTTFDTVGELILYAHFSSGAVLNICSQWQFANGINIRYGVPTH